MGDPLRPWGRLAVKAPFGECVRRVSFSRMQRIYLIAGVSPRTHPYPSWSVSIVVNFTGKSPPNRRVTARLSVYPKCHSVGPRPSEDKPDKER